MKRRLTAVEWESLCEHADGRRAAGAAWHDIEEAAAAAGVCEEDLEELQARHRRWSRREKKEKESRLEMVPEAGPVSPGPDALTISKIDEAIQRAALYICGEGIVKARPVWRKQLVSRTLRSGDRVEVHGGPGASWMVCAVIIQHEDGTREILPEHRVRQRIPAGKWARTAGETLRMQVLDLEDGLNTRGIVQRVAAVSYCYFGERSGIRSASELARLSGVSRQRVHTLQGQVRNDHKELAGDTAALAGQVPARRPKRTGGGRREAPGSKHQDPKKL